MTPDDFGRYYHGNLIVGTPQGSYRCAIDVDPKNMPDGIEWRSVSLKPAAMSQFKQSPNGWHPLASNETSGALDYIRSSVLHPPLGVVFVRYDSCMSRFLEFIRWNPPWKNGTGIQALTDLESILTDAVRCYVFGEPFNAGLGVHNVHQNQGDRIGSGHEGENAIWQDGATIIESSTGKFTAFLNKFKTQAYKTDALGRPA
ncbi:YukJ family protein [Rhizobium sp. RCAM05350]|nr:YukJ family protein [Rhizobium sp. RCAM05350]